MSDSINAPRATFTAMADSTPEDWMIIGAEFRPFAKKTPERVLAHLKLLEGDFGGFAIDRLQHSLQTATRAHRDGRAEDYVVMALLHDIGDTLCAYAHPEVAAAILYPYVSEELHWIAKHHGAFQGKFYFHHLGFDPNMSEAYRGHAHFQATADFCEKYDQCAFDPDYDTADLGYFEPMLQRVMARPIRSGFKA